MFDNLKRYIVFPLTCLLLSGCKNIQSSDDKQSLVLRDEQALASGKPCVTFGFRNWLLQRGKEIITLSAEASMPTPAWSVVLHSVGDLNQSAIELTMETVEPAGPSSSVVSWVPFEKSIETNASYRAAISVSCAGKIVWKSQDS